jgi:alkylation response protein AidB-like acyl-CoA dehydrogenase
MVLVLSQDETMIAETASGLFTRHAPVSAFRALRDSEDPLAWDRDLLRLLAESGLVAPNVQESSGGLGLGAIAAGLIAEQSGHVLAAVPLLASAMAGSLIAAVASEEQKARLLPAIVSGASVIALALDEAPRHRPDHVECAAAEQGGAWTLTGSKTAVIEGFGADGWLISARTGGEIAVFLVAKDATGIEIERFAAVDSRNYARLRLTATPAERLGQGDASGAIAATLDLGRALLAAELLGICDEAFSRTVAYLKERKQFGRLIGSFQALQHRAARLYGRLEFARGAVIAALRAIDEQAADATWLASLAKSVTTRLARELLAEAVQMHGGIGVTDAYDIGLFVKRGQCAGDLLGDDHFHTERLAREHWQL